MSSPVQMFESELQKVIRRCIKESDLTYNQAIAVLEVEKHRLIVQMDREEKVDNPYRDLPDKP